jgi:mRNA-degrading endonuclease RelE of RelBE toxin-antitoxin system
VSGESARCTLVITPTARRQLAERLPEAVAVAAYEFIVGPLLNNPYRVGKQLHAPLADRHSARRGTYRVIYRIDEQTQTVSVLEVQHRRDAYRTRA